MLAFLAVGVYVAGVNLAAWHYAYRLAALVLALLLSNQFLDDEEVILHAHESLYKRH